MPTERNGPEPAESAFELSRSYVQLGRDGAASRVDVGPDFWATIAQRLDPNGAFLVTRFSMTEDWPHWEMHPEGEELVVLISGAVDLILDDGKAQRTVELRPDAGTWINQRGVWHRALVREPSDLVFITAGNGTQHRPA